MAFLNVVVDTEVTCAGSLFQSLITLCEKQCHLTSLFAWDFLSLKLCPLVASRAFSGHGEHVIYQVWMETGSENLHYRHQTVGEKQTTNK